MELKQTFTGDLPAQKSSLFELHKVQLPFIPTYSPIELSTNAHTSCGMSMPPMAYTSGIVPSTIGDCLLVPTPQSLPVVLSHTQGNF